MPKLRRVVAWFIDFALVLAGASLLAVLTFQRISALITDVPELAADGSWRFLTSRGDAVGATGDMGRSLWREAAGYVQQAFAALVVGTFLYQWAALTLAGRTLGKALMGLRVDSRTPRRTALRAAVTTTADVALYSIACCLLVEGMFLLSFLCWTIAVAVFLFNAVPVFSPTRRSLADRVAGTSVAGFGLARTA
ncbi:RDD family protein [Streptomyces sp. 8N616]|uniref:RDD family protein n=1 Tax=Streptomyces sp. 8N616 TaxID=3457414 RepID=UPI003FD42325